MKRLILILILALGLGIVVLAGVGKARAQVSPQDVVLIETTPNTNARLTNLAEFSGYKEPGSYLIWEVPWVWPFVPSYDETLFRDSMVSLLGQWMNRPWNIRDPGWKGPDSMSSSGFINEALLRINSSLYVPPGHQIDWPGWSMRPGRLVAVVVSLRPGSRLKKGDIIFRRTKIFDFRPDNDDYSVYDHLAVVYSAPDTGLILADTSSTAFPDVDGDGVPDPFDNCVGRANPGQEDSTWLDGNFVGDACEGPPQYSEGDLNEDGERTPADVVLFLNCVFMEQGETCGPEYTDLNMDGSATPSDVVLELNWVFMAQGPPCCP